MQLDHIFIRASRGAPEAELLSGIGLTEGSGNHHAGQGTENRRFFLRNSFIELLWIADTGEIQSPQTRRTSEPMWFFLAAAAAPDAYPLERREPLIHPLGVEYITSVTVTMSGASPLSAAATAAGKTGQVHFIEGATHLMEIVFDGHRQGGVHDLRPRLPLIFKY